MKRDNRTGPRLFFIEFLIVLFFFLIVSTVCLRLFARAHVITQRADTLSHAQAAASSAAAALEEAAASSAADASEIQDILDRAAGFLTDASVSQDGLTVSYDGEFQPCSQEEAVYTLTALFTVQRQDPSAVITVSDRSQKTIYELPVTFHRPLTRREALQQ